VSIFFTIHPDDAGEIVYGNCDTCGVAQAIVGAYYFEVDTSAMEEAWASAHICGDPDLYGLLEYYDEESAARFFGLPHFI
jgi:hypothetical protein